MIKEKSQFSGSFVSRLNLSSVGSKCSIKCIRLVRKAQNIVIGLLAGVLFGVSVVSAAPFTISGDKQEVTDSQTGLVWRRCPEGMSWSGSECAGTNGAYTHEAALQYALRVKTSTGVAWRLPNVKELASILDRSVYSPAVDRSVFSNVPSTLFWSSSPIVGNSSYAYTVDFNGGLVGSRDRTANGAVWLVR